MKRLHAYLLMAVPYIIGCFIGWFIFIKIALDVHDTNNILLGLFLADLCATIIVWFFGVLFKNSSFYDAYWSLIPWLLLIALLFRFSLWSASTVLLLIPFTVWSWRLTVNWAYTCKGIKTEDWRYKKFRAENKTAVWHIINFFGINLMPTLVVFLALVPAVMLIINGVGIGLFNILGATIITCGIIFETVADISMHRFLKSDDAKNNRLKVNTNGLWGLSRHPNYFGEILIWVGVYVSCLSIEGGIKYFAGVLAIILMFVFISIPMAERRQLARRAEYAEYRKNTRMLLPLPRLKKSISLSDEQRANDIADC